MTQERIIEAVCEVCGIEPVQLKERSRKEPLPTARALIAHFLSNELKMTPRDIWPLIGKPHIHRTSVYHYLGKSTLVEQRTPFQKELRDKEKLIREIINSTGKNSQP